MTESKEFIIRCFADRWETVRELIRCKDCANHEPEDYCHIRDGLWYDNDYCSSAERKTE